MGRSLTKFLNKQSRYRRFEKNQLPIEGFFYEQYVTEVV